MAAGVLVQEIMSADVVTVGPKVPFDEVAWRLFKNRVSGLPVVADNGDLLGMVTEFDVISKSGATASDIMSSGVVSVEASATADELAEVLSRHRVRRVPVLRDGQVVGIVSRWDLIQLLVMTRWMCADCGYFVRGFKRPESCVNCGGQTITLEREPPGM